MATVSQLGYLGFEVSNLSAWENFATNVLGMRVVHRAEDGTMDLRMDDYARRISVHPGEADDLAYAGFEVDTPENLLALVDSLRNAGYDVTQADAEQANARRVSKLFQMQDPDGIPLELYCGPDMAEIPFASPLVASGYLTEAGGLGHIVLGSKSREETVRFYQQLLGFRLSDEIQMQLAPEFILDISFLHVNTRHHTVAVANVPMPKRIDHFMLEVGAMDDVGLAYERFQQHGLAVTRSLGQHPNDGVFSFYARTPSGFDVEIGWGGKLVDDTTWQVERYNQMSVWGHNRPAA